MPNMRQWRNSDLCLSLTSTEDNIEVPPQLVSSPWNQHKFLLELHPTSSYSFCLILHYLFPCQFVPESTSWYISYIQTCASTSFQGTRSKVEPQQTRGLPGCFAVSTFYLLYHFVDFGILWQFLQLLENSRKLIWQTFNFSNPSRTHHSN